MSLDPIVKPVVAKMMESPSNVKLWIKANKEFFFILSSIVFSVILTLVNDFPAYSNWPWLLQYPITFLAAMIVLIYILHVVDLFVKSVRSYLDILNRRNHYE